MSNSNNDSYSEEPKTILMSISVDTPVNTGAQSSHLSGLALTLTLFALCIAIFCVALDNTIISTAIPRITDEFRALQDIGWYGSAYLLTTCAFQLPFGKLYGLFSPKWVFLAALLLFEIGSVVCGAAPSSVALIVGRAIAGIGAAGIFSGSLVIIAHTSPMEKRPMYNSLVGGMFGIASVVGPLIGGAFTDHVSWRWCFYINLPIGAVTSVILIIFLRLSSDSYLAKGKTILQMFLSLDPLGLALFMPAIICVLLALQWGGSSYSWGNGRIISLFVTFSVALIAFVFVQAWLGENATIPPRIGLQRTIWASSLFTFCLSSGFFLLIYFLPIYFQAVKGMSALSSGIASIPLILSNVVSLILVGGLITKFGFYIPFVYVCIVLVSIAAGLVTMLGPHTGSGRWIGYQILYGFGVGCAYGIPQIAAQTVLPLQDVPTGLAITIIFQNFGPAVLLSAGNNVLNERLLVYLARLDIEELDARVIVHAGATAIRNIVPGQYLGEVVGAYNGALRQVFLVALVMSCSTVFGGVCMEWKKVKKLDDTGVAQIENVADE